MRVAAVALLCGVLLTGVAPAQEERPVRVGIAYRPGVRPGVVVLPGTAGLDSTRAIVHRDLDYSDLYEVISLPGMDSAARSAVDTAESSGSATLAPLNHALYRALGAEFAVQFAGSDVDARVLVHRVTTGETLRVFRIEPGQLGPDASRLHAHRLADAIVRVTTRNPGIAATRFVMVRGRQIWRVDSDGADPVALTDGEVRHLSPAWTPDGRRLAFMTLDDDGVGKLFEMNAEGGSPRLVFGTGSGTNYTPAFSPDGRTLIFSRVQDSRTHIFTVNLSDNCCLRRLTVGRFSDNLNPTFSPDGSRIAFVSDRPGLPQIYVMDADGGEQELFAPFDYGISGASYAPEWSPDGQQVAFHRVVGGTFQVFVMSVRTREVRQLTSTGTNEDATWAPDSRHLAFVSNRTGSRQVWVIDLETGRVRQVTRMGGTRLPAWSPPIVAGSLTP